MSKRRIAYARKACIDPEEEGEELPFEPREIVIHTDYWLDRDYTISDEVLGRGKFGEVKRCTETATGLQLAAKMISSRKESDREDVRKEIRIMAQLRHPKILQIYDAFENKRKMCIITEVVEGGELFDRVVDPNFDLTERVAILFMRQIVDGVAFIHSRNILHLDMKPENVICVAKTGTRIKIIDFGLAMRYDSLSSVRIMAGTIDFMAPEVCNYEDVTPATDMWSVGVICYVLVSGLSPFCGDDDSETICSILRVEFDFAAEEFDEITAGCKDFIKKLLVKDPRKRMSAEDCLKHSWLNKITRAQTKKHLSKKHHIRFFVRRKWKKVIKAVIALNRMVNLAKQKRISQNIENTIDYQSQGSTEFMGEREEKSAENEKVSKKTSADGLGGISLSGIARRSRGCIRSPGTSPIAHTLSFSSGYESSGSSKSFLNEDPQNDEQDDVGDTTTPDTRPMKEDSDSVKFGITTTPDTQPVDENSDTVADDCSVHSTDTYTMDDHAINADSPIDHANVDEGKEEVKEHSSENITPNTKMLMPGTMYPALTIQTLSDFTELFMAADLPGTKNSTEDQRPLDQSVSRDDPISDNIVNKDNTEDADSEDASGNDDRLSADDQFDSRSCADDNNEICTISNDNKDTCTVSDDNKDTCTVSDDMDSISDQYQPSHVSGCEQRADSEVINEGETDPDTNNLDEIEVKSAVENERDLSNDRQQLPTESLDISDEASQKDVFEEDSADVCKSGYDVQRIPPSMTASYPGCIWGKTDAATSSDSEESATSGPSAYCPTDTLDNIVASITKCKNSQGDLKSKESDKTVKGRQHSYKSKSSSSSIIDSRSRRSRPASRTTSELESIPQDDYLLLRNPPNGSRRSSQCDSPDDRSYPSRRSSKSDLGDDSNDTSRPSDSNYNRGGSRTSMSLRGCSPLSHSSYRSSRNNSNDSVASGGKPEPICNESYGNPNRKIWSPAWTPSPVRDMNSAERRLARIAAICGEDNSLRNSPAYDETRIIPIEVECSPPRSNLAKDWQSVRYTPEFNRQVSGSDSRISQTSGVPIRGRATYSPLRNDQERFSRPSSVGDISSPNGLEGHLSRNAADQRQARIAAIIGKSNPESTDVAKDTSQPDSYPRSNSRNPPASTRSDSDKARHRRIAAILSKADVS